MTELNLSNLFQDLMLQKAVEDAEKAKRIAIEEQILSVLEGKIPEKGQRKFSAGSFDCTIKTGFNYKLIDKEIYQGLMAAGEVPDVFYPTLSESKINALVKTGDFGKVAKHFDVTPAKPNLTVVQARI